MFSNGPDCSGQDVGVRLHKSGWPGVFTDRTVFSAGVGYVQDWGLVTSLRVFYQDGLEVGFGITAAEWAALALDNGTAGVIANGMVILVDKAWLLAGMTGFLK